MPNRNNPRRRAAIRLPSCGCLTVAVVAVLVTFVAGCTATHPAPTAPPTATLTAEPSPNPGGCAPDQLVRCVPGLADLEPDLFAELNVLPAGRDFAALPLSWANDSAPKECQNLPSLGGAAAAAIDANYRPAVGDDGKPIGHRFAQGGEYFGVRFTVADNGEDPATIMSRWSRQCTMWGFASTLSDNGIHGWMVAESADKLAKYQSGDTDNQWPFVTHTAATTLANGVVVQAVYRTNDPSAESRSHVLSAVLRAAGHHQPRAALPPELVRWNVVQLSTLLPPLAMSTSIDLDGTAQDGRWLLCPQADHGPTPRYDPGPAWTGPQNSTEHRYLASPSVTIARAHPGVDYLAQMRREIDTCTSHLADIPQLCNYTQFHQSLTSDSAIADGENILRITQRWIRVQNVQGYDRCVEGTQAVRIAQVRGLIVTSKVDYSSVKGEVGDPPLMPDTLDQLIAGTVHAIKAA